jgi:hypothetical protein
MELQPCIKCGRGLKAPQGINQTGDRAFAFFTSAVTVGIRPRLKSRAQRRALCVPCGVSIAMSPAPEGAFNENVHTILQDMVRQDPTLMQVAWEQQFNSSAALKLMPGSKLDKTFAMMLPEPEMAEIPLATEGANGRESA